MYGRHTFLHSDHEPLKEIFKKSISQMKPYLQCMLMSLIKFDIDVVYKSSKEMHIADVLSRACLTAPLSASERKFIEDIDATDYTVLLDSDLSINTLRDAISAADIYLVLPQLRELIRHGFLGVISSLPQILKCYHSIVHNVNEVDGVFFI